METRSFISWFICISTFPSFLKYGSKEFFDINFFVCRTFHITPTLSLCFFFTLVLRYFTRWIFTLDLVSYQDYWYQWISIIFDLLYPIFDSFKCFLLCNIKNNDNAISFFVKSSCQCSKSLLTCSIPNLNLDIFIFRRMIISIHEIESKRRDMLIIKWFVNKSSYYCGLTNWTISY